VILVEGPSRRVGNASVALTWPGHAAQLRVRRRANWPRVVRSGLAHLPDWREADRSHHRLSVVGQRTIRRDISDGATGADWIAVVVGGTFIFRQDLGGRRIGSWHLSVSHSGTGHS